MGRDSAYVKPKGTASEQCSGMKQRILMSKIKFLRMGWGVLVWQFLRPHMLFHNLRLGWLSPFCL